jgi:DnaJ-class molecular chaperone
MIAPSTWRNGSARAHARRETIPESERCEHCRGWGERMAAGRQRAKCQQCGGSGRRQQQERCDA